MDILEVIEFLMGRLEEKALFPILDKILEYKLAVHAIAKFPGVDPDFAYLRIAPFPSA